VGSSLKLLVPCGYGVELKVAGPVGVRPDTRIVAHRDWCERVRLPQSLDRMTFTFPRSPHPLPAYDNKELIQNFYHHGEFFVVTAPLLDFLRKAIPGGLESVPIDVRHDDGRPAEEPYFAAKVVRTIDCIDRKASRAMVNFSSKDTVPFDQAIVSLDLGEAAAVEFANADGGKYASFPNWYNATKVQLIEERIPPDVAAFQPALWPNHVLTAQWFARDLEDRCRGGTRGYYFWTLDLANPSAGHRELMQALR
jgi:hypothetical protein